MKQRYYLLFLLLPLFIVTAADAQQQSRQTLLWRISGNGLQKPSYLYGTMHLYNRKLFYFGDSVYHSMESTDGFAMEIDPNDMMDSTFSRLFSADTTSLLRKILDKEKYDSVSDELEKKFGMPANKITRRKLIEEREGWYYKFRQKDDMKTFMDLYLYDIARKQGKWVGGIEDVNDQINIKDELGKDINIVDYLKETDNDRKKSLDNMVEIYIDQDIDKIERISSAGPQEQRDILLLNRNNKMARRIDSIMRIRTCFFAIGAAHLPGDSGVISLLMKRGFEVTPVFSSKKINPDKYKYEAKEIPWVNFVDPDSTYTVNVPGRVSNMDLYGGEIKFKICADLTAGNFYMTTSLFASDRDPEEALEMMQKNYSSGEFKSISQKRITRGTIPGFEMLSEKDGIYFRMQAFVYKNRYYLAIAGCLRRINTESEDFDRFLNSFTINPNPPSKVGGWIDFTDEQKAFAVSFPKKPSIDKLREDEAGENMNATMYTSLDLANGTYYMVMESETDKGYVLNADSSWFAAKINAYKEKGSEVNDIRYFKMDEFPALSFNSKTKLEGVDYITKLVSLVRGNKSYVVVCVTQKGKEDYPDITRFLRSFKLLPYKELVWQKQFSPAANFSTWAPSPFERFKTDTTAESSYERPMVQYLAYDSNRSLTYNIVAYPVSKYFWIKSDSSFLTSQAETYYTDTSSYLAKYFKGNFDSLLSKKVFIEDGRTVCEVLTKNPVAASYKKVRIFLNGDTSYHIFISTTASYINTENNNRFFRELTFKEPDHSGIIYTSKTGLIIKDLHSSDSLTRAKAREAVDVAPFSKEDIPLLYSAYLDSFPVDSNDYRNTNEIIGAAISKLGDSSLVEFIRYGYSKASGEHAVLKLDMLRMLATMKTKESYRLLKELLIASPPAEGKIFSFVSALEDSMQLARSLFPEAKKLYSDSLIGPGILKLAVEMVDSNLIEKDILISNKKGIIDLSDNQLRHMKKSEYNYADFSLSVVDALKKINDEESNKQLYKYISMPQMFLKEAAVIGLLENNKTVPATELYKMAADTSERVDLYISMKKIGKEKLYPKEFLTQKKFAESYLYTSMSEDDETSGSFTLKPIGDKAAMAKGKECRYFLFRVTIKYEEDKSDYLAVCGPFEMDPAKLEILEEPYAIKVFYDELYSQDKVNDKFYDFIRNEVNATE